MANVTRTTTWADGNILTSSALNGEFNNLLNALGIVDADIASNAAIASSKIASTLSAKTLSSCVISGSASPNPTASGTLAYDTTNNVLEFGSNGTTRTVVTQDQFQTLTNKNVKRRFGTVTQSATPTINTDSQDVFNITALAQAITSMTTNLSGTPSDGDLIEIRITDNGSARGITWGTSFESTTVVLPTTTVISTMLRTLFEWNATASKWDCIAVA